MASLTSFSSLGICGGEKSLSTMTPLTSMESSIWPPTLASTSISSKLMSLVSKSATAMTASTAMLAILSWHLLMILEPRVVLAVFTRLL